MTLLDCPECGGPLEVADQFSVGDFECGRLVCVFGHIFIANAEWLAQQGIFLQPADENISFYFSDDPNKLWEWLNKYYD